MLVLIAVGVVRTLAGAAPIVTDAIPATVPPQTLGILLLMRAFADGCTAITGVEAVQTGVPAFKRSESWNARITLTVMAVLVGVMFLGTSWLAEVAGAVPAERETVLCSLGRAVFGGVGPRTWCSSLDDGDPHPQRRTPRSPISRACPRFWPAMGSCRIGSPSEASASPSAPGSSPSRSYRSLFSRHSAVVSRR